MTKTLIKRDGEILATVEGTEFDVLAWFHRNVSTSMSHALEHEGYSVEETEKSKPSRFRVSMRLMPGNLRGALTVEAENADEAIKLARVGEWSKATISSVSEA